MKILAYAAAGLLGSLSAGQALAQSSFLSESVIDSATYADWRARQQADSQIAASAEADPTVPEIEPAPAGDGATPGTESQGKASDAEPPKVQVPGEPDMAVATPDNTTDIPDEAALQTLDDPDAPDPFLIRLQVLLDRADASPGVIDGYLGENTRKAVRAYEAMRDLPVDGEIDSNLWNILVVDEGRAMTTYRITDEDVSGRYVKTIPDDYAELAEMDWLGFHGPAEMLAEKFHMDEELLKALNPQADFSRAGEEILVTEVGEPASTKVARITVDRAKGALTAYDDEGAIVLSAPATIGSEDNPSPSGTVTVKGVAPDPTYSYDPEQNFTQGDNTQEMTIPPGPNGPVGTVWIDLSKPTYGIHGTAHPALIDKTVSHGCVRLTNWDAEALAELVRPGETQVEFVQ